MFLCIEPGRANRVSHAAPAGFVTLVQKDSAFHVVDSAHGGASGRVWYDSTGPQLHFRVAANGLRAGLHYLLELNVDGTTYEVLSQAADAAGVLVVDTTLEKFDNGVCVSGKVAPPRALDGAHEIKFLIKRDGNPATGTTATNPRGWSGPPCRGNGDFNYTYALFEGSVARYVGTR
jgi:hypothetical protein